MDKLSAQRDELDKIDQQIFSLIKERVEVVKKIGQLKKENKLKIKDINREKEILESLTNLSKRYKINPRSIEKIWKELFKISYKIEGKDNG